MVVETPERLPRYLKVFILPMPKEAAQENGVPTVVYVPRKAWNSGAARAPSILTKHTPGLKPGHKAGSPTEQEISALLLLCSGFHFLSPQNRLTGWAGETRFK